MNFTYPPVNVNSCDISEFCTKYRELLILIKASLQKNAQFLISFFSLFFVFTFYEYIFACYYNYIKAPYFFGINKKIWFAIVLRFHCVFATRKKKFRLGFFVKKMKSIFIRTHKNTSN